MRFSNFIKLNHRLLTLQSKLIAILFLLMILFSQIDISLYNPEISKNQLQININTATKEEIEKVPYIGEKTAEIIIHLREVGGQIDDINHLKFINNFDKFKYYLKTED